MSEHTCDDGWFDRALCEWPCDRMHFRCTTCGEIQDHCPHEEGGKR